MSTQSLQQANDYLILIGGEPGAGKSASLMDLKNQEGVLYMGTEAGKKLPFKNKFEVVNITDTDQVLEGMDYAESQPHIHTVVIDSASFLMDMFESTKIVGAKDSRAMWGAYAQYWKTLMQQYVARSSKNVIITTHITSDIDTESNQRTEQATVKGALKNVGLEAYFSLVVTARTIRISELENQKHEYLNITEEDRDMGYKHVFQVRKTKDTTGSRIRGPLRMFSPDVIYMDNNVQMLLDIIHEYYEG